MKNILATYNFNQKHIRAEMVNNEPYFCCVDVCNALSIKNNRNVITRLKDGVHSMDTIDIMGRKQAVIFISEPNLYKIALQSRKPEAEAFVNWICKEVLPSIRKNGYYEAVKPQSLTSRFFETRELRAENKQHIALISTLQQRLLQNKPIWKKIIKYKQMGLSTIEIGKLVGRSPRTISHNFGEMRKLNLLSEPSQKDMQLLLNFNQGE